MGGYAGRTMGPWRIAARALRWGIHPGLVLNVAAPLAAYEVLTRRGASSIDALIVGAAFPLIAILAGVVRTRRLDPIGALSLIAICAGVVGSLAFDSPRFLVVKDSVVTGLLGIACLGSLLAPRPFIFLIGRQLVAGGDRERAERYDRLWGSAEFRARSRRSTLVWGIALVVEAGLRAGLSFLLAPGVMLVVSPVLGLATFGPLAVWTLRRSRRSPGMRESLLAHSSLSAS
jgi:hypothetical protein